MSRARKFLDDFGEGEVNEGSIIEYEKWAEKNSKKLLPIIKLTDETFDIRDRIQSDLIKWADNADKLKKMAKKLKPEEFPEGPRSSEGKDGFIDVQDIAKEHVMKALREVNTRVG